MLVLPTRELCLQIFAVCESIVESLAASLGPEPDAVSTRNLASIACGCVVGGVDFVRQRQALLGQRPRLVVATPGRLLSQCGVVPASSKARASAAEERGEASAGGGVPTEHLLDVAPLRREGGWRSASCAKVGWRHNLRRQPRRHLEVTKTMLTRSRVLARRRRRSAFTGWRCLF